MEGLDTLSQPICSSVAPLMSASQVHGARIARMEDGLWASALHRTIVFNSTQADGNGPRGREQMTVQASSASPNPLPPRVPAESNSLSILVDSTRTGTPVARGPRKLQVENSLAGKLFRRWNFFLRYLLARSHLDLLRRFQPI